MVPVAVNFWPPEAVLQIDALSAWPVRDLGINSDGRCGLPQNFLISSSS